MSNKLSACDLSMSARRLSMLSSDSSSSSPPSVDDPSSPLCSIPMDPCAPASPFLRQIRTPQPKPGRFKATSGPAIPKRHLNALGFVSIGGVSAENDTNCSRRRFDAEWPTAALLSPRAHPRAQTRPNKRDHRNRKVNIDRATCLQYLKWYRVPRTTANTPGSDLTPGGRLLCSSLLSPKSRPRGRTRPNQGHH